jgi:sirohydrochlorin cobaltochelatase
MNGLSQQINQSKTGILLVTFGTSYSNAQQAFENIDEEIKKTFPGTEVRWAYTSNFIRNKLKKQGKIIDSPAEALARYAADGYTHIGVQSLHVIPGQEYDNLKKTVNAFNHMPKNAEVTLLGEPLLYYHEDIDLTAQAIKSIISATSEKEEAVVLMGHGTHHQSNVYYAGFQYYLNQYSDSWLLGTVEGFPELKEIIAELKARNVKAVRLMPFMTVAGDHVLNDMAGEGEDSWKSQLEAQGFKVNVCLKGLAEYDVIVGIWIKHLKKVMKELE